MVPGAAVPELGLSEERVAVARLATANAVELVGAGLRFRPMLPALFDRVMRGACGNGLGLGARLGGLCPVLVVAVVPCLGCRCGLTAARGAGKFGEDGVPVPVQFLSVGLLALDATALERPSGGTAVRAFRGAAEAVEAATALWAFGRVAPPPDEVWLTLGLVRWQVTGRGCGLTAVLRCGLTAARCLGTCLVGLLAVP